LKLVTDLIASVSDRDHQVVRACIGLHWTMVESLQAAMAHTYKTARKVEIFDSGRLAGQSALGLASRLASWEPLEASLGLAALNSLVEPRGTPGNVLEEVARLAVGKVVTVIGRFPMNDEIAKAARQAFFLEMDPRGKELPAAAAEEVIPRSDVAVITATALINGTLQRLLELGRNATTIVLGPSTPMNDVLLDYGATILAGVRVESAQALLRSVMEGVKSFQRLEGIVPIMRSRGR
jgi:uncharacterized protein (DUF4213/DUF364 family)